jgi:hypothetical protein
MSNNKFLQFYKTGTPGLLLTGLAQIWLGTKGQPELFATGLATIAGVIYPLVAQKRLDGQIKSDVLTPTSPVEAITKGVSDLTAAKDSAIADYDKAVDIVAGLAKGDIDPLVKELLNR